MAVILIIGLGWSQVVQGADLSFCSQNKELFSDKLRCALWRLTSFMHSAGDDIGRRTTGPVILGPKRRAVVEASVRNLSSPWPTQIVISLYRGQGPAPRLEEKIVDTGLNGLQSVESGDFYWRYSHEGDPINLLENLDPKLKELVNKEYLAHLEEVTGFLRKKTRLHGPLGWKAMAPGLETARLRLYRYIRLGKDEIHVLRLDPEVYDLVPYSYQELNQPRLMNIEGWAEALPEAEALFNSGQYYPDTRYMGLHLKDGLDLGTGLHPRWMALLLSGGPSGDPDYPPARILDLEHLKYNPEQTCYRFVVQSFMLLDLAGRPRVRQSDRLASRTVLAQDDKGRILVAVVPGACTLYELALLLRESELGIKQAMCLDGGFESQLFIRAGSGKKALYGEWVVNERRQHHVSGGLGVPLPAVIAVQPR